jgi:hypothetical protein
MVLWGIAAKQVARYPQVVSPVVFSNKQETAASKGCNTLG